MRRLTIIVATASAARLRAALSVAAAEAALERPVRLFLQGGAAALLRPPIADPEDPRYAAAGLPTLAQLLEEALAAGVRCSVCQSGLALAQLPADALPPGFAVEGLISLLADAGDDRLLLA